MLFSHLACHLFRYRACVIPLPMLLMVSPLAFAVTSSSKELILQQQRQRALEQQSLPPTPDVRLLPPASRLGRLAFPQVNIDQVPLSGQDALLRWLPLQRIANQAQGHCLGGKGINLLMSTLQNPLVDHGYITTCVLAPQQDLTSGTRQLKILPGYVH